MNESSQSIHDEERNLQEELKRLNKPKDADAEISALVQNIKEHFEELRAKFSSS